MAPASLSAPFSLEDDDGGGGGGGGVERKKASLSLDEAKTEFLHVVAKLKPTHASMFFHWLQQQINAYKLNGFSLHGNDNNARTDWE